MKRAGNQPVSPRNEFKTLENGLSEGEMAVEDFRYLPQPDTGPPTNGCLPRRPHFDFQPRPVPISWGAILEQGDTHRI
jgi:hypothetical protein